MDFFDKIARSRCCIAGGYTLVVKAESERGAKRNQPGCLGIYRMMDYHNGKPVYRQDTGDYYLYFIQEEDTSRWIIGESGMTTRTTYSQCQSHEIRQLMSIYFFVIVSSYLSISGCEIGSKVGWIRNTSSGQDDIVVPALDAGWQYQPLKRPDNTGSHWRDDRTLKVEVLRGQFIIEKLIPKAAYPDRTCHD